MRFKPKHESSEFTLWGDMDGKTVEQVIAMLSVFPAGAVIDARTRPVADPFMHITGEEDYFVLTWNEEKT